MRYLASLSLLIAISTGCQTTERSRYQTLANTQTIVNVATASFRAANAHGKISQRNYDKATQLYETYQAAMNLAIDKAQGNLEAQSTQEILLLSLELIEFVEGLNL